MRVCTGEDVYWCRCVLVRGVLVRVCTGEGVYW